MDWQRSFLIGAMLVVLYMLFLEWDGFQEKHNPIINNPTLNQLVVPEIPGATYLAESPEIPGSTINEIPSVFVGGEATTVFQDTQNEKSDRVITVSTDVLTVHIDTHGGDIVRVELLKHLADTADKDAPFILLNTAQQQQLI